MRALKAADIVCRPLLPEQVCEDSIEPHSHSTLQVFYSRYLTSLHPAQVLVETFETGEHITKYVEMGAGAPHNADLAELGSGAMLQMMLVDSFVHADLHPGAKQVAA